MAISKGKRKYKGYVIEKAYGQRPGHKRDSTFYLVYKEGGRRYTYLNTFEQAKEYINGKVKNA